MAPGVELPMNIFGRRFRPFSLALLMATIVVVYQYEIIEQGPGPHGFDVIETMFASAACTALFFGWLLRSDDLHEWGLVLAAGVWSMRATLYLLEQGLGVIGFWLSVSWVVGATGAWLLESFDHRWKFHFESIGGGRE